jgi:putative ABC transport system substrate-binding protein
VIRRREFIVGLGSAAAWPLAARAQQPARPVIGFLAGGTESQARHLTAAFRQGLGEQGYVEGLNVEILNRWADTRYDSLPALAAGLVRRRVAVIAALSGAGALAAKSETATIPIVFATSVDPVEFGLVASLNRPGGNVTGTTFLADTLTAKRLELLHEIVPAAMSIGILANPTSRQNEAIMREAEVAACSLGVNLMILSAVTPIEIEKAFATLAGRRIGALLVLADALFNVRRDQLVALAACYAVPTIYPYREHVDTGGLMSYGASISDALHLLGVYAGRILKGEKPADLPVQQSTKIELVINLKTAKALGLTIPETLLATADEVIQ